LCRFFFVGDYIFAVNLSDVICISGSVIAGHGVVRSAFVVVGYTVPHDAVCDGPAFLPTGFADTVFREITVCRVECPIPGITAYGSIITVRDCAVVGAAVVVFVVLVLASASLLLLLLPRVIVPRSSFFLSFPPASSSSSAAFFAVFVAVAVVVEVAAEAVAAEDKIGSLPTPSWSAISSSW
jgi:hypothetical protein